MKHIKNYIFRHLSTISLMIAGTYFAFLSTGCQVSLIGCTKLNNCESGGTKTSASSGSSSSGSSVSLTVDSGSNLNFQSATVGFTKRVSIKVTNPSSDPISGLNATITSAGGEFSFSGGTFPGNDGDCSSALAGGASCNLSVGFTPLSLGAANGSADINFNGGTQMTVSLTGQGKAEEWTWLSGDTTGLFRSVFGTKGLSAPSNWPGPRTGFASATAPDGKLWVFGGYGIDSTASFSRYLNDLWVYDPSSGEWTWVSGSQTGDQFGVYGTQGVSSASNFPGGRRYAQMVVDSSGNIWLHGGFGYGETCVRQSPADLWKFNVSTSQWTWMAGPKTCNTKLDSSTFTHPGSRQLHSMAIDSSDVIWLFGGTGFPSSPSGGPVNGAMNDLWKYDISSGLWSFVKGITSAHYGTGTYGTKGTESASNLPSSRQAASIWIDSSDNLWVFGGETIFNWPPPGQSNLAGINDMWRFRPSTGNWTWMSGVYSIDPPATFGTQGTASASNVPAGTRGASSNLISGNSLYLFGGKTTDGVNNQFWEYNTSTSQWTWHGGTQNSYDFGLFDSKGVASSTNTPGHRSLFGAWTSGGQLYLMGGERPSVSYGSSDLWSYDLTSSEWTFVEGNLFLKTGVPSFALGQSTVTPNPAGRFDPGRSFDKDGNVWLYGDCTVIGCFPDIWKFDVNTSTWSVVNDRSFEATAYGVDGVFDSANIPEGAFGPASVVDASNNLYVFGGYGNTDYMAELWKYDTTLNQWAFLKGQKTSSGNFFGVYGTQGVEDSANTPGPRAQSAIWLDADGMIWMFGGDGYDKDLWDWGVMNDLWRYNPTTGNWAWIKGSNDHTSSGSPGVLGVADPSNEPMARTDAAHWTGKAGKKLWMFGGYDKDYSDYLYDLWKFDTVTNQWTRVSGAANAANGIYGTKGVPSGANHPGARQNGATYVDSDGNLWLFGGQGYDAAGGCCDLSDLWKFDVSTNQWTWMAGSNTANNFGSYGTMGIASTTNLPGGRTGSILVPFGSGFKLLGGWGRTSVTNREDLNDTWLVQ